MVKKSIRKSINLVNKVNKTLIEKNLLNPNASILLAVSGGQDSSALFFFFINYKNNGAGN